MRTTSCHGPSGVVTRDLAEPPPPTPPSWGGLTRIDPLSGLAGEARERVHQNNLRVREGDAERYASYVEDYLRGARSWRTPEDILAYGPPATPGSGREDGATMKDDLDIESWYFNPALRAYRACTAEISDLIARVEGRPVPLTAYFEASVTAKVEAGGRSFGGSWSSRGGASPRIGLSAGGASVDALGQGRTALGVDAGALGVKATLAGGQVESVEVKARALPGVAVHAKRSASAVEHSLSVGGQVGSGSGGPAIRVEGRIGIGVNLVSAELIRQALSSKTYWDRNK